MAGESARAEARRARLRAERLAHRAAMFEKGAEGEAATAAVLAALPQGWSAIHDVRWPSRRLANIDHILVGPGGIFVIDSKNWSGEITLSAGHLRQNGRSREKAVAGCADAGLAIAELAGPHADKVFPVLCFVTDQDLSGWSRDVMLCSTATLTQMLTTRPPVLSPDATAEALLRLDAQLRAAVGEVADLAASPRRSAGHAATSGRDRSSRRHRRGSLRPGRALAKFVASGAVLLGFVAYGPQISTAVGGLVAEELTKDLGSPSDCSSATPAPKSASGHQGIVAKEVRPKARDKGATVRQSRKSEPVPDDC